MIELLPRIADMLLGFGWGAIVFWILPKLIKDIKSMKGDSSRWS